MDANWVEVTNNLCVQPTWLALRLDTNNATGAVRPWLSSSDPPLAWEDVDRNDCVSRGDLIRFGLDPGQHLVVLDQSAGAPVRADRSS